MEQEQAQEIAERWVREEYGKLLGVGEMSVARRASGRVWSALLCFESDDGEHDVGVLDVDETGKIVDFPKREKLLDALLATRASDEPAAAAPLAEDDFSDLGGDDDFSDLVGELEEEDSRQSVFGAVDPGVIDEMARELIASGERDKLLEARTLLPQLLTRPDGRGEVLRRMGELELLLGELELGINYLEAAAREFADLADMESLGAVAEVVMSVVGEQRFSDNAVKRLLDRSRARMRPIDTLGQAPVFLDIGAEELFALEGLAQQVALPQQEDLMREGAPAISAYVVKSGVLSIRLATPDGGSRIVRSCFPGDFIGESSVLGPEGATCTATVRAECLTTLWHFAGRQLKSIGEEYPLITARIESARTMHRLDSFLSMHEAASSLDVAVRDHLLGCINGIRRASKGESLGREGKLPDGIYLVAEGRVELRIAGQPPRAYETDNFVGLRDTLHELVLEGDLICVEDSLLVSFEPEQLKKLAAEATPEVVAVLDRLD